MGKKIMVLDEEEAYLQVDFLCYHIKPEGHTVN